MYQGLRLKKAFAPPYGGLGKLTPCAIVERLRRPVGLSLEAQVRDHRNQHHGGHYHKLVLVPRYHVAPLNLLVRGRSQS